MTTFYKNRTLQYDP